MGWPKLLLNHSGSKILALLLALFVYAHVYTEQERVADFSLPVRTQGLRPNLILLSQPPETIRLALRGNGKELVKMRVRPPEVILDLAQAGPGDVQRIFSAADVLLPSGSGATIQEIYEPRVVTLRIDTLVARSVPVEVALIGEIPPGYSLGRAIEANPSQVLVQGALTRVDLIRTLKTEPVNLSQVQAPQTRDLKIRVDSTLVIRPQQVTVALDLIPTEKATYVLPVVARGHSGGGLRILPETATIQIEGPAGPLRRLDPAQVGLWVEVGNLPSGLHRLAPITSLPVDSLEVTAVIPSEFLVDIGP